MKLNLPVLIWLCLLLAFPIYGQDVITDSYVVSGVIKDAYGDLLPGVSVYLKSNKSKGTVSDIDGNYRLPLSSLEGELVISYIGMKTQTISIKNRSIINIVLEMDEVGLGEVIVTGYGSRSKNTFTGTASQVKIEDLQSVNPTNLFEALKVFDPSFSVVDIEGLNGSDPNFTPNNIQIRGQGSLPDISEGSLQTYTSLPIFILDGFQVDVTQIYDLDMNRIQSVTILKDAAASSIYGSRAANGVIVIETKTPSEGKLQFSYSMNASIQTPDLTSYNLMNADEALEYLRRAQIFNNGEKGDNTAKDIYENELGGNPGRQNLYMLLKKDVEHGTDTYWLSQPLRTALQHSHTLTIEGGSRFKQDPNQRLRYQISLNAHPSQGVMKGSGRDKYSAGMKLLYVNKNLQITNNMQVSSSKSKDSPYGSFSTYTQLFPFYRMKDDNGDYFPLLSYRNVSAYGGFPPISVIGSMMADQPNPLYEAAYLSSLSTGESSVLTYNLGINWEVIENLRLKGTFSLNSTSRRTDVYKSPFSTAYVDYTTTGDVSLDDLYKRGDYTLSESTGLNYTANLQASYLKNIQKHTIQAVLGGEIMETKNQTDMYKTVGFLDDALRFPSFGIQYQPDGAPSGSHTLVRSLGAFSTANYSWDNRYLMDLSIRMDGSSNFASKQRMAPFWSGGLRWNMHNESFVKNTGINNLAIKGTIGTTGNQNFQLSQIMSLYQFSNVYDGVIGAELMSLANESLKWQTTLKKNLGVEFSLLDNRLGFDLNLYSDITNDNITDIQILPSTGFSTYKANMGEIENKGVEFSVNVTPILTRDLRVSLFLNGARNENTLLKISDALKNYNESILANQTQTAYGVTKLERVYLFEEGKSLNDIYAVRSLGIDPATGDEVFLTKDGEKTLSWNAADQVVVGNTDPDLRGFFRFSVDYKRWNLSSAFEYSFGADLYNNTLYGKVEGGNFSTNTDRRALEGRWSQPGDVAQFRGYTNLSRLNPTSRFVQKNNYLSMTSLRLMYNVNTERLFSDLSMLRLSLSTNDLFYASTIKQERGINYPFARTFYFTIQANF